MIAHAHLAQPAPAARAFPALHLPCTGRAPIDGLLLGDDDDKDHNYHFSFELHTEFTYDFESNQVFEFRGHDDVWVFINDTLVIDLGGRHGPKRQFVDLNRLGLTDGGKTGWTSSPPSGTPTARTSGSRPTSS